MDDFDIAILKRLQTDCSQNSLEIGAEIGLSASSVQRRIKKLKETGAIKSEIAVLNPDSFKGLVTVIVEVVLHKGGTAAINRFSEKLNNTDAVQQVFYIAGQADFMIIMVCQDMAHFEQLSQGLFMDNENVAKFTSNVVIGTKKQSLALML